MNKHRIWGISLCCLLFVTQIYAKHGNPIYQVSIPVASQDPEVRAQAEKQTLIQIIEKVSGNPHVIAERNLDESLKDPEKFVNEFSYSNSPATSETPYTLNIHFDENSISGMLRNANKRTWNIERPQVLAWVEYEVPQQRAAIIESGSLSPIQILMKRYAGKKGLSIVLPVMDITDLNRVDVNDIVTMAIPIIKEASKRYSSEAILITRILKLQEGYSIQAKLVAKRKEKEWEYKGKNLEEVLAILMNNVADTLSGDTTASSTMNAEAQEVTIKVTGISEEGDLNNATDYLNHLAAVAEVIPIRAEGNDILLKIVLISNKDEFMQTLSEGQKLVAIDDNNDGLLHYQWTH